MGYTLQCLKILTHINLVTFQIRFFVFVCLFLFLSLEQRILNPIVTPLQC